MSGATATPAQAADAWEDGSLTDELASGAQNAPEDLGNLVEGVPVTFDDAEEHSLGGGDFGPRVYRLICEQSGIDGRSYIPAFRAEPRQFHCAAEASTTVSSGSLLSDTQSEVDPNDWRGVFALQYQRRELFSGRIELNVGQLPRWKPQIIITRRMLDIDDE